MPVLPPTVTPGTWARQPVPPVTTSTIICRSFAAFDELAAPTSFDAELRTFAKASELVLGAGGSWDAARYHVVAATYLRGTCIWNGKEVLAKPGTGRFVPRQHNGTYVGEE